MNSSPEITIVHLPPHLPTEKATVPEMFLLYNLVAQAALQPAKLRQALGKVSPEQRQFLHTFFVGVTGTK